MYIYFISSKLHVFQSLVVLQLKKLKFCVNYSRDHIHLHGIVTFEFSILNFYFVYSIIFMEVYQLITILFSFLGTPRTLQDHCRLVIRHRLGQKGLHHINLLPIANIVKDYVRYKDHY